MKVVAQAVSIQGKVEVRRAGQTGWRSVTVGEELCAGDRVRTNAYARAAIWLRDDDTVARLGHGSTLAFPGPEPATASAEPTSLGMLTGVLHFISRTPQRLEVRTPSLMAIIEGTEFVLRVTRTQTRLWVYEGRVTAENAEGTLTLTSGEAAQALSGQAPRPYLGVDPQDAVQWALYYPPLIDLQAIAAEPMAGTLREAARRYRQGDIAQALNALEGVRKAHRKAAYYNLKTALLLSVGRVEEARTNISAARKTGASPATPLAYEAIIALARNRKEQAHRLAQRVVELEPGSPIAYAARSYARQAAFDLEGALADARHAVKLTPDNALAHARLAELELASGYSGAAIDAAEEASALDPAVARTQSVLGFVYLARVDTDKASKAFTAAIARDQADPLPRLGLGLAKIRAAELLQGRREIEFAASLDPGQSIVRSYLGKAYFEEKRGALAAEQYAIAKQLDPQDPTPWFYDAILKQTENRPVQALKISSDRSN